MLSKNKIKLIKSLNTKKNRNEAGLFVAEGEKLISEIIDSQLIIIYLAGTKNWFDNNKNSKLSAISEQDIISQEDLNKISFLKTPQSVLCLVKLPVTQLKPEHLTHQLSIVLDNVQDPGNVGTIIRIADWFGIEHVICNLHSADIYSPKVIQATMGAICRVNVYEANLEELLPKMKLLKVPIYGTMLNGENIYKADLSPSGIIIMGNESKGIHPNRLPWVDKQLFIPYFPENQKRSESLNVAVATAIVCAEFRRRLL